MRNLSNISFLSEAATKKLLSDAWAEADRRLGLFEPMYIRFQERYWSDPVGFIHDCIRWSEGKGPEEYQDDVLSRLVKHRRECVRSLHGAGKTAAAAWAILWFALTRDGRDWKIVTTASVGRQLYKYLWPEVHKWIRMLRWDVIGRGPFDQNDEQLTFSLKLSTGEAFAVACKESAYIEGAHADHLMYVFDEAKLIPDNTWDAAEGAFSGAGDDMPTEALAFAISTPGPPSGRFYEIQTRRPGFADWDVRHIKKEDAIAAGRVSREWVEARKAQWGEKSSIYRNRVEGEFAAGEEEGVIPLAWVERANDTWEDWREEGFPGTPTGIGVDVGGRIGGAETITALCLDHHKIKELRKARRVDPNTATMQTTGEIKGLLDAAIRSGLDVKAFVDVIGIGTGIVHRLKEQEMPVVAFNSSEKTDHRDSSDEFGFKNKRSAGWWIVREMLDPAIELDIALPPDDQLVGDLTAPSYRVLSGAVIQVEAKEVVKKRLKRSTDCGDAVVYILSGPTLYAEAPRPKAKVVSLGG